MFREAEAISICFPWYGSSRPMNLTADMTHVHSRSRCSLNREGVAQTLDALKHKGIEWATLHAACICICIVMLGIANTAVSIGRPDLKRCTKNFQC